LRSCREDEGETEMEEKKLNCWDYMKCGREPGGEKAESLGTCLAATDASFDGINAGRNAGRICWAVAGTCQEGKIYGTFAEKRKTCVTCDFYKSVQQEEGTSGVANRLLNFFSEPEKSAFVASMTCRVVKAGERFVSQGEVRDSAYIIQRGSCLVVVEKGGELHPVDHRTRGDIVGVRSLLTGEPQTAHVEAETDMELWTLKRGLFEDISQKEPELTDFLTELVVSRFDSRRPTADRVIGKYIATDIIGRGGHSIVYRGIHAGLNMPVAIKMLKHDRAMDPDFSEKFRSEAKTIARLNHANIVKVYDIEELYKTIFIIMEHLDGAPLDQILARMKKLPVPRVLDILLQTCAGLAYAHEQGIVHQDIKPGNILVQFDDKIKILDFGLACSPGCIDNLCWPGTVFYASPEYIKGDPVDARSDIYSLGITVYEMLTGQKPFPEDNAAKAIAFHLYGDIKDPAEIISDLPRPLWDFVLRACRKDLQERYQSMDEVLADLRPLAEQFGLANKASFTEKRRMATLFMVYKDYHHSALTSLMEEFNARAQDLGIDMKVVDFKDI
jgi:tRNA A-37 threonylcarbamoyl transferase component Bud32